MVTAVKKAGNRPRRLKLVQVMLLCITRIRLLAGHHNSAPL